MDLYIVFVSFEKDIWILFFSQLMRKSYSKTQTTETSQQREKKDSNRNYYYYTRARASRACLLCARIYTNVCEVVIKDIFQLCSFFVVFEKNFLSTIKFFLFFFLELENG